MNFSCNQIFFENLCKRINNSLKQAESLLKDFWISLMFQSHLSMSLIGAEMNSLKRVGNN